MNINDIQLFKKPDYNINITPTYDKLNNPKISTKTNYEKFGNKNTVLYDQKKKHKKKIILDVKKENKLLIGTAGIRNELVKQAKINHIDNQFNQLIQVNNNINSKQKFIYNQSICSKLLKNCIIEYDLSNIGVNINNKILEIKIYSNLDYDINIKLCVDNNEIPKSNILLNKNWITINYIDPKIYKNPKILTLDIDGNINIRGIYCNVLDEENIVTDNINLSNNISNKLNIYKKDKISNICIGIIADNFTYENINYLFNTIYIKPESQLDDINIDLLLCESAWAGIDESWRDQIYTNKPGHKIINIIDQCKRKSIPTIFYAKEDPIFFDGFKNCSILFDLVITTAQECVEKYRQLGCKNIIVTTFLVNPIIHNPIRTTPIINKISFPGSYYKFLENRSNVMNIILDNFCSKNLDIYDRKYLHNKATYQIKKLQVNKALCEFPEKYNSMIKPGLTYSQVITSVYKQYKCILNINTISDSQSMFSRRVMEVAACGTNIISNYSLGMAKIFSNHIHYLNEKNKYKFDKNFCEIPNINIKIYEITHMNYTYKHLFRKIFDIFGMDISLDNKICILTNYDTMIDTKIKTAFSVFYNSNEKVINTFDWILCLNKNKYFYTENFVNKILLPTEYVDENITISRDNNIFKFNVKNTDPDTFLLNTKKILNQSYLFDNIKNNFSINNIYDPLRENCFDHTQYIPNELNELLIKVDNTKTQIIIMCQWNRIENLENIIINLNSQSFQDIHLYIWNNNFKKRNLISQIINNKVQNFNISWFDCEENIGGFGRFIMAKYLLDNKNIPDGKEHLSVPFHAMSKVTSSSSDIIFIDDDQILKDTVIFELVKMKKNNCGFHWSGRKFYKNKNYWDSWSNIFSNSKIENYNFLDYGGTGTMIIDSKIFRDQSFYYINKKYLFIEDLWMSYFSIKYYNYKLYNCSSLGVSTIQDNKDNSLNKNIINLKNEFLTMLRTFGEWNV